MSYDDLIKVLVKQTGYTETVIKNILLMVPHALVRLEQGEKVRTPLGVFGMTYRKERPIKRPDGEPALVEEKLVVRLKPGVRLQRDPHLPQDPLTGPPPSPASPELPPEASSAADQPQP